MNSRFLAVVTLFALFACGGPQPEPVALPQVRGVPYQVSFQTFDEGGYADQPFNLILKNSADDEPKTILRAEQCKNVSVAQTASQIYVFYDELMLAGFTSIEFDSREPTVLLCDQHALECRNARKRLGSEGVKFSNVCSYVAPQQ